MQSRKPEAAQVEFEFQWREEMDPVTSTTIAGWLIAPAASALFEGAKEYLLQRLGLSLPTPETPPLLEEYLVELQRVREELQQVKKSVDEERIAMLYGALSQLKDASRSSDAKYRVILDGAVPRFHHVIALLPQEGETGKHRNAELRSMAFIGMAASYYLLDVQPDLIADKMVQAVETDATIAKQWLGESLVTQITRRMEVPCPKCGHRNPPESRFCNQDGYPLIPGMLASPPVDKRSSWCPVQELLAKPQFSTFAPLAQHYRNGYEEELVWALRPDVRKTEHRVLFPLDFANVALALFTAVKESPTSVEWITLFDIPRGFMLELRVYPEHKLGGLSYQPPKGAHLYYIVEEVTPLTRVTGIFHGGKLFGSGYKYLITIVSLMETQLKVESQSEWSSWFMPTPPIPSPDPPPPSTTG